MKIKTTVHAYFNRFSWEKEGQFIVYSVKLDDTESRTYIGEQEIEIEVPDGFDPTAQQIAVLEKQKTKVMADYQKSVTDINRRISELQAITYTGETA